VDAVADHSRFVVALDIVARDGAAGRADAGHGRPAQTVAELVADDAAEHAADDGPRARALRPLADGLDRRDRADSLARHDARLYRRCCRWRDRHRLDLRRTVRQGLFWSGRRNRRVLRRTLISSRRWRRIGRHRSDRHRRRRRVGGRGGRGLRRRHRVAHAGELGRRGLQGRRRDANRRCGRLRGDAGGATGERCLIARATRGQRRGGDGGDGGDESTGSEAASADGPARNNGCHDNSWRGDALHIDEVRLSQAGLSP